MMESKYYTPEIGEFHVGFEFETNNGSTLPENEQEWVEMEAKAGVMSSVEYDLSDRCSERWHRNNSLRVKHLDREDIESFGWKDNEVHTGHAGEHYWIEKAVMKHGNRSQFEELHLIHQPYNGWVLIWQVMRLTIGDSDSVRFSGVIKNKSELKRILKQIGV